MINKWEYKYGIWGTIIFLVLFTLKEIAQLLKASPALITFVYIFMLLTLILAYFNYIKYSILNEKNLILYSTIFLISSNVLYNVMEYSSRLKILDISTKTIFSVHIIMFIALMFWSIVIVMKKKIYGRSLYLLGVVGIILSSTYNLSILILIRLPLFYVFYTVLIFPFVKKKDKKEDSVSLLRR